VKSLENMRTRAIPESFCGGDSLRRGAVSSAWTLPYLTFKAEAKSDVRTYMDYVHMGLFKEGN